MHLLPDDEFIDKVVGLGGIPDVIADDKEMIDLFLPILKADFKAVSSYMYEQEEPLDIPITVMLGSKDRFASMERVAWQEVTNHRVSIHMFSGGHRSQHPEPD